MFGLLFDAGADPSSSHIEQCDRRCVRAGLVKGVLCLAGRVWSLDQPSTSDFGAQPFGVNDRIVALLSRTRWRVGIKLTLDVADTVSRDDDSGDSGFVFNFDCGFHDVHGLRFTIS